ncbi:MAG TPA: HEAT repeat domain-containing protein [Nitrospiraceae bacterium]|nr:HEAT repeat domain-containing protein [Nitrospiraceae bacterium]
MLAYSVLTVLLFSGCYLDTPPADPDTTSKFLVALLDDPNPEVRRTAAEALGKVGASLPREVLVRTLSDPDPRVREAGVIAMGRLSASAGDPTALVRALKDTAVPVKRAAARSLGEWNEVPSMDEALVRLLKDPETTTRRAAIQALLQVEMPGVFSQVTLAAKDPDAEVRQGAVATLGEWWGAKAIPILRDRLVHDEAAGVRAEAAYQLGKIGDDRLVKELRRAAETDKDEAVRRWAQWASSQLMPPSGSG